MGALKNKKQSSVRSSRDNMNTIGRSGLSPNNRLSSGGISRAAADSASFSNEVRDELIAEEAELCKRID
jgi:hypothetical protein